MTHVVVAGLLGPVKMGKDVKMKTPHVKTRDKENWLIKSRFGIFVDIIKCLDTTTPQSPDFQPLVTSNYPP